MRRLRSRLPAGRAVSPVVGTVLLVAIVLLLAVVSAGFVLGLSGEQDPAPQVKLALEQTDTPGEYRLVHESGDTVDGDRVTLRGVATPAALAGEEFAAGKSVRVTAQSDTIRVVWTERQGATSSYVLRTFEPASVASTLPAGTVFTGTGSRLLSVEGDGGETGQVPNASDVAATGPAGPDLTGDGKRDVPYVTAGGTVSVVNADGDVTPLANSSDISGSVETTKTRVAIDSWDGSPQSVFFVNQNHDTLYRVSPSGTPQTVATPGDGVQAVVGVGDVDSDSDRELVFADGSQQLRYIDGPGGSIENVEGGQTGSNNGIGAGTLADIDGDSADEIVAVDGSNQVIVVEQPGSATDNTTVIASDAVKAPVTVADVDTDGSDEVVYVGTSNERLRYVDDPLGSASTGYLTDSDGDRIDGSDETGVV